jgi:hypothetical protein
VSDSGGPVVGIRLDLSQAERELASFINSSSEGIRRIAQLGQQALSSAGSAATPQLQATQAASAIGVQRAEINRALSAGDITGPEAKEYRDAVSRAAAVIRAQAREAGLGAGELKKLNDLMKVGTGLRALDAAVGRQTRATKEATDATEAQAKQTRARMSAAQRAAKGNPAALMSEP